MPVRPKSYDNAAATGAMVRVLCLAAFWTVAAHDVDAAGDVTQPTVAGWVEQAWLSVNGVRISVSAKLDTGARSASINAPEYREFQKGGKTWIAFVLTNEAGDSIEIEAPLSGTARIRRAGDRVRERPVIELEVCVAGHTVLTDITLADRSRLNYQLLIGRKFLASRMLVDSSSTFVASGRCH